MKQGKLTVIGGPMFAGKTTLLQKRVRDVGQKKTVAIKPSIDVRYDPGRIVTHAQAELLSSKNALGIPAVVIDLTNPLLSSHVAKTTTLLAVDEANFFAFDILYPEIQKVLALGVNVIVTGLLYDAMKRPFGATLELMEHADEKIVLSAVCVSCGGEAHNTKRLRKEGGQVLVGGADLYAPCCDVCWESN